MSADPPLPLADAGRSNRRPTLLHWLAATPLAGAALVDLPRTWTVGPMSGLGAITVGQGLLAGFVLLACGRYPRRLLRTLTPYAVFLFWALLSPAWGMPDVRGAQNLAAYLFLGFATASAAALAARDRPQVERVVEWGVRILDVAGLALIAVNLARHGWSLRLDPARWLVQPRAVSLMGLVPIAWHLARWYRGRERDLAVVALWVAAIFVSLSRMATATALVMIVLAVWLRHRARPALGWRNAWPLAVVAVVAVAALYVAPFRERTFRDRTFRDRSFRDGAVGRAAPATWDLASVNDSDRLRFWRYVAASALERPIVGQGIGSSQEIINDRWPVVGHPHNDYLRVWHDLGIVGVAALATAFAVWLRALARAVRDDSLMPAAGLLALVGLVLPMITDNALVYPFVVGPVGVVVGAGLGAHAYAAPHRRRRRGLPPSADALTGSDASSGLPTAERADEYVPVTAERAGESPPRVLRRRRRRR